MEGDLHIGVQDGDGLGRGVDADHLDLAPGRARDLAHHAGREVVPSTVMVALGTPLLVSMLSAWMLCPAGELDVPLDPVLLEVPLVAPLDELLEPPVE